MSSEEDNINRQTPTIPRVIAWIVRVLTYFDNAILVIVSLGIIIVAGIVLIEGASDILVYFSGKSAIDYKHTPTHILSDFLFVLIVLELMRQVIRQLQQKPFSLNPFLFIGVIASVRGILIVMMGLALNEIEWVSGTIRLGVYALVILILVVCYSITTKTDNHSSLD